MATSTATHGAKKQEDVVFTQRQSTMDAATLDKLLMAEKNLFQAGQATLQAWKLIGRDPPSQESEKSKAPVSSSTSESTLLSSSPSLSMEIPRPEGRFANEQALSFSIRPSNDVHRSPSDHPTPSTGSNHHPAPSKARSSHNIFGFSRDFTPPPRSDVTLFTFTVRKSDSVLEKLGSKKASIQLQVDIETRMLNFISPHDHRESYSCAAVTARPHSRLGIQLKIQTGNASLTKKMTFYSSEDRANFMDALEQGKVMCKKASNRSMLGDSVGMEDSNRSTESSGSGIKSSLSNCMLRETLMQDPFALLPGETVLEHVQRVTNLVIMSQSDRAVQGVLKITTYRVTFAPYDPSWKFGAFEVPLAAIDFISRDGLMLLISCKDLRTIRLAMHDAYSRKKGYDQLPSTPDIRWLNLLTLRMKPPTQLNALFAFDYHAEKTRQLIGSNRQNDGWLVYSPVAEYQRLGFLKTTNSNEKIQWRLLKNSKFRFSPTYPQLMVVPSCMSEEQLVQSARFRSRARLPVVVWKHPVNKSVLARSSQPNYGMAGNRSEADRLLLRAYRDSAAGNAGLSPPLHIIDARKPIATKGNRLKGKGVENSQHYDNANVEFMGIANIHKMRESLDALKLLVSPSSVEDGDKHYHNRLENTRWLKHVMRVLSGARRVAEVLHEDGASVLVHCSDGWDRTPQLVALAQLILDPYYRTIRGFAVLVEKEWCSFGHKFADRIGVGKDIADQPNERSPVMLQFLDCVWQMTRQFPTCFEFNEAFLLHVADALLSGLYGTFLYNSERERIFEKVWERTESVWTPVLENPLPFQNPLFKSTNRVLYPRANLKRVVLWDALFFRWDPENHPDYMEFMVPMVPEDAESSQTKTTSIECKPSMTVSEEMADDKALWMEIDYDEFRSRTTTTALPSDSDMSDDDDTNGSGTDYLNEMDDDMMLMMMPMMTTTLSVSDQDLATCVRVLEQLGPTALQQSRYQPLRKAMEPMVAELRKTTSSTW